MDTVLGRFGIVIVGLMVVFSGCLAGEETASDSTSPSPSASPSTAAPTSEGPTNSTPASEAPAPNTPPTGTLTSSLETGPLPLNVTFNMTADDADGDNLTWSLDADGDGTADASGDHSAFPANYSHLYDTEGIFNATFVVEDATSNATHIIAINVTAAAAGGAVQQASGSFLGGEGTSCVGEYPEQLEGVTFASFAVDPATPGQQFQITLDDVFGDSVGIDFFGSDGSSIEYFSSGGDPIVDTIPAGSVTAYVWACFAADVSFEYSSPVPVA